MPFFKLNRIWKFCTYNKPFFIFILILYLMLNLLQDYVETNCEMFQIMIIQFLVGIIVTGYGMIITRERINDGIRLPKIEIRDVVSLGVKSSIVLSVLLMLQGEILDMVSSALNFPIFDLEELLLDFHETIHLLYTHNPIDTLLFFVFGALLFYITTFFLEIALARLADTGSLVEGFDLIEIKKDIDVAGWRHYTIDYTSIILVLVFLSYLKAMVIPVSYLDYFVDVFLSLLIFATQFLGIGAIYSEIKDKKREKIDIIGSK